MRQNVEFNVGVEGSSVVGEVDAGVGSNIIRRLREAKGRADMGLGHLLIMRRRYFGIK